MNFFVCVFFGLDSAESQWAYLFLYIYMVAVQSWDTKLYVLGFHMEITSFANGNNF